MNKKKTLINSALISTAGFFIAKLIGLFYTIPFSHILQSTEYMNYYGSAYRLYSYFLSIFTSAIPFAAATMIAKYMALNDEETTKKVNRLSIGISAVTGIFCCVMMLWLSKWFAPLMAGTEAGIEKMENVLGILSTALLFVPLLAGCRGYVQGRKEMKEYAFSQSFEQIFRVGFLLSSAYMLIYIFNADRVWTLYMAVFSTTIAALAGLAQIWIYGKRNKLKVEGKPEEGYEVPQGKALFKEFIWLAVPYMISAILGYSDDLYNTLLLPTALKSYGLTNIDFDTVMSAVNFVGIKLCSIPMVLAPAISSALIGHMSEAFTKKEGEAIKRNIMQCLTLTLYAGIFLTVCIMLYIEPVYNIGLFYTDNLALASDTVRWCAIEGFMGTLAPIVSTLMMTCGKKKQLLKRMCVSVILKGLLLYPLVKATGYQGAVLATVVAYGYLIVANTITLFRSFELPYKDLLLNIAKAVGAVGVMTGISLGMNYIYPCVQGDIIRTLTATVANGLASAGAFGVIMFFIYRKAKREG